MKKSVILSLLMSVVVISTTCFAQTSVVQLNNSTNGSTKVGCSFVFTDDGGANSNYSNNQERSITFCPQSQGVQRVIAEFELFDLGDGDVMYIFDGPDLNSAPHMEMASSAPEHTGDVLDGVTVVPPPTNTSGCLTFKFVSDGSGNAPGWKAKISCDNVCQDVEVALGESYARIDSMGVRHEFPLTKAYDTTLVRATKHNPDGSLIYDSVIDGEYWANDIIEFYALNMCLGDSLLIINANPVFPYSDYSTQVTRYNPDGTTYVVDSVVGYHQDPEDCIYFWSYGDEKNDTVYYDPTTSHHYPFLQGYNLNLQIKDTSNGGCTSRNAITARVRVAKNPIKTVASLPDMCSGDRQQLFVGYSGNSTIIMDSIAFSQAAKEEYNTRTFIPDGGGTNGGCFDAPVTFTTFAPGATIDHQDEVRDICVSMEHSFVGDIGVFVICPNGQQAELKYNQGSSGGTYGALTGVMLGNCLETDSYSSPLDSNLNPIGNCWNYCFSNIFTNQG